MQTLTTFALWRSLSRFYALRQLLFAAASAPVLTLPVDDLNTVTKVFSAVLTALVGAVGFLFRTMWNKANENSEALNRKLDQCEEKHEVANTTILELTEKVGKMEGRFTEYDANKKEMRELHEDVLREIRRAHGNAKDS